MKMNRGTILDQGTVIRGIVSDKYEGICCYGVIISASCDIANKKIKRVYFLTAVDVKDWVASEVGFLHAVKSRINNQEKMMKKIAKDFDLDYTLLVKWKLEETQIALRSEISDEKKINQFIKAYTAYNELLIQSRKQEERERRVSEYPDEFVNFIKEVDEGKYSHLYYLSAKYYKTDNTSYDGIVVDIQEVSSIPLKLALQLKTPGIDCRQVKQSDKETLEEWKKYFWLPSQDSYVSVEGIIESPRREHLMQHFSNGFVRIGIDRISNDDYDKILNSFKSYLQGDTIA